MQQQVEGPLAREHDRSAAQDALQLGEGGNAAGEGHGPDEHPPGRDQGGGRIRARIGQELGQHHQGGGAPAEGVEQAHHLGHVGHLHQPAHGHPDA